MPRQLENLGSTRDSAPLGEALSVAAQAILAIGGLVLLAAFVAAPAAAQQADLTARATLEPMVSFDGFEGRESLPIPFLDGPAPDISTKAAPSVNFDKELVINHLQVVENPARTTGCGAWTFCAMMTSLADGKNPSQFTLKWLQLWLSDQYVNGQWVQDLPGMQNQIINRWPKKSNGELDLTKSPFRLLAIANRMDLRKASAGHAGEGRMVYGFYDASGNPRGFTVIFEYSLSLSYQSSRQWALKWHELGSLNIWGNNYKNKLQALTDSFARTKVNGKIQLNQLRTNDTLLCATTCFWEFREFDVHPSTGWMRQTTVAQTPPGTFNNTTSLRNYINANESAILNGTHVIGSPLYEAGNDIGHSFSASGINNDEARHRFSLATCSGCHIGETSPGIGQALFTMIDNRAAGAQSNLSLFFSTTPLQDANGIWRVHDERGRRISFFQDLLVLLQITSAQTPSHPFDATKSAIRRLEPEIPDHWLPSYDRVH